MKRLSTMTAAAILAATPAFAADITIGVPNWPSVAATANILKVAIEDNLGLTVELQNGTNPIVFEAMDKGSMDAHPEVWMPNQQNLHDTYVVEKGKRSAAIFRAGTLSTPFQVSLNSGSIAL